MAWEQLNNYFGPGMACQQGAALNDLSKMILAPAKNPEEMRKLINELTTRMKAVYDITKEPVDDTHAKSILLGVMDPLTKQHLARTPASACHSPWHERSARPTSANYASRTEYSRSSAAS